MPTAVWHELGPAAGGCSVCSADGTLSLGEARFTLSLVERLRNEYCPPPARLVTCAGCGWRWSVRATDVTTVGRGVAREDVPQPRRAAHDEPATASRTVLPQHLDRRRGRDRALLRR